MCKVFEELRGALNCMGFARTINRVAIPEREKVSDRL